MEWEDVRRLTAARIGLERSGASLATRPLLELRLAHARARDAVHAPLDERALLAALDGNALLVSSQAEDRRTYLMRPDLGRALRPEESSGCGPGLGAYDLAIGIGDGLSAAAARAARADAAAGAAAAARRLDAGAARGRAPRQGRARRPHRRGAGAPPPC